MRKGGKVKGWIDSNKGTIYPGFSRSLAANDGNIVVSMEGLSWVFDRECIARLQGELVDVFSDIKIVAYLRRQDKQVVSHHQQGSKVSGRKAARFYGNQPTALPQYQPHFQDYLNYSRRIGFWADAFGDANIYLRIFERDLLKDGDVVSDFFAITGMETHSNFTRQNESVGFVATKLGHLMQQRNVPPTIRDTLLANLGSGGKMLPSAQEAIDFYANFRDSNKSLNNRFKLSGHKYLFDDDFSGYPSLRNDLWTEDLANEAILGMLTAINDIPVLSPEEETTIRECAMKIEARNPALARELLRKTLRSQP